MRKWARSRMKTTRSTWRSHNNELNSSLYCCSYEIKKLCLRSRSVKNIYTWRWDLTNWSSKSTTWKSTTLKSSKIMLMCYLLMSLKNVANKRNSSPSDRRMLPCVNKSAKQACRRRRLKPRQRMTTFKIRCSSKISSESRPEYSKRTSLLSEISTAKYRRSTTEKSPIWRSVWQTIARRLTLWTRDANLNLKDTLLTSKTCKERLISIKNT